VFAQLGITAGGPGLIAVPEADEPGLGSHLVAGWLSALSLLLVGFVFSYFWTASTIIYFLLRKSDDATELDEVYRPEEEERDDLLPLVGVAASGQPPIERPLGEAEPPAEEKREE
jgi:hypothetical protein